MDTTSCLNALKLFQNNRTPPPSRILMAFGNQPTFLESTVSLTILPPRLMINLFPIHANPQAVEEAVMVGGCQGHAQAQEQIMNNENVHTLAIATADTTIGEMAVTTFFEKQCTRPRHWKTQVIHN